VNKAGGYQPEIDGLRTLAVLSVVLMILLPVLLYSRDTPFPGLAALVPCVW
jgi:peptidoglycan/LPS O-acetylase OafA/YrhL